MRALRQRHPNLGPLKLRVLLAPWCAQQKLPCPSARTLARLIHDDPQRMRITPQRLDRNGRSKPRTPRNRARLGRNLRMREVGQCVAFDTIARFINSTRRHLFTATDHAARFAAPAQATLPCPIRQAPTDNGSEFAGAFHPYPAAQGWRHCHTYPRCPKINAHAERFNRTKAR